MRISWNWLTRYIHTDLTPQQAAAILTSTGLECESVTVHEPIKGMLRGVVVGHVLECRRHPDADRLSVTMVDLGGGEPVQIVCGAPNVAKGQKVLVATVGADLCMNDGTCIVIKKSKIRGQESQGMICAEDELGLGHDHDGILVLDPDAVVGTPAAVQLGLVSDHVLEIGLTPNRTDAMGHVGVARDLIAAINHREGASLVLDLPDVSAFAQDDDARALRVEVQDAQACPRYAGVVLKSVKVGPSPAWLQDRLKVIGLKPINNVVDVTNYVQHELGQPLHAFDADRLEGGQVIVRKAAAGERFITLDGKERVLDAADLVIADAHRPVCLAGVFGGAESGVGDATTAVFLESAYFDASTIRRTARRHGLSTDASFRFERGVDPELTVYALKRAALLLKEVAGASIGSVITDVDNTVKQRAEVKLDFARLERSTGLHIPHDQVVRILELLDFRVLDRTPQGLHVQVPAYRVDVHRQADVEEEVLRIHGYDHIPLPTHLHQPPVQQRSLSLESLRWQTAQHLAANGFREVMTPSLVNGERMMANAHAPSSLIALANPLSAELDVLRPSLLAGVLQAMAYNINRQQRDLCFFERGRRYRAMGGENEEREMLSLAMTGRRMREGWRSSDQRSELPDLKEELERLLDRYGLLHLTMWVPQEHPELEHAHAIVVKGRTVGHLGAVKRSVLKAYDVAQPIVFAEWEEDALLEACQAQRDGYHEVPRYPSVRRDLSLMLDQGVRFEDLRKAAQQAERKLLKEVGLFDVYQGDKLPAGKKSYALNFILQDAERTLTDDQVDKAMSRIRQALEKEFAAVLRA
ncbi:MAG: phenylalanine--tRNA ligase subunit beta [Flavobacteriales bacterium]|nr:phenylalanine--tRNA ligase subunit beta [Flavobacteriales bacterium]